MQLPAGMVKLSASLELSFSWQEGGVTPGTGVQETLPVASVQSLAQVDEGFGAVSCAVHVAIFPANVVEAT